MSPQKPVSVPGVQPPADGGARPPVDDWATQRPVPECRHTWTTGTGPSDPNDTGVHMCVLPTTHEHLCNCGHRLAPDTSISPRVDLDEDGTLDDFCATDVRLVHFEALDKAAWYATVELAGGEVWQLNFGARNSRAKGYARAERVR